MSIADSSLLRTDRGANQRAFFRWLEVAIRIIGMLTILQVLLTWTMPANSILHSTTRAGTASSFESALPFGAELLWTSSPFVSLPSGDGTNAGNNALGWPQFGGPHRNFTSDAKGLA